MRDRGGRAALAAALLLVMTACSTGGDAGDGGAADDVSDAAPSEGTGLLVANDLRTPPTDAHFTASPTPLRGQVVSRPDGCVAVVVDGVTRIPIWPDGTAVVQSPGDPDRYVVTLPGGAELVATPTDGDEFTADGVVDDSTEPFVGPDDPPSLVTTFLGFCAVDAAPVLFADATSFVITR